MTVFYDCRVVGHLRLEKLPTEIPEVVFEKLEWLKLCRNILGIHHAPVIDFGKRNVLILRKATLFSENDQLGLWECVKTDVKVCTIRLFFFSPPYTVKQTAPKISILLLSLPKEWNFKVSYPFITESFYSCDSVVKEAKNETLRYAHELDHFNPSIHSNPEAALMYFKKHYVRAKERLLLSIEEATERAAGANLLLGEKTKDPKKQKLREDLGLISREEGQLVHRVG
jgi:hypothetical protein